MHISPSEEFGIRCLLQLAKSSFELDKQKKAPVEEPLQANIQSAGTAVSASKVAEREGLSIEYVSKLLFYFRKSGIVHAARGAHGGFYLAKPASDITLKDAFDAVSSETRKAEGHFCNQFSGQQSECVHLECCAVRPVWTVLSTYFDDILKRITLADLLENESDVRKKMTLFAKTSAKELDHIFGAQANQPVVTAAVEFNPVKEMRVSV